MSNTKKIRKFIVSSDVPIPEEPPRERKTGVSKWLKLGLWTLFVIGLGSLSLWTVQNFWDLVVIVDEFVREVAGKFGIS